MNTKMHTELTREDLLQIIATRQNEAPGIRVGVTLGQALFENNDLEPCSFQLAGIDYTFELDCIKGTHTFVDIKLGWAPWRCELPEDVPLD